MRVLEVAARQGDAHGDDAWALEVLDRGLARHPDAGAQEQARALLYRIELLVRLGRRPEAEAELGRVRPGLHPADATALAAELDHAHEVLGP